MMEILVNLRQSADSKQMLSVKNVSVDISVVKLKSQVASIAGISEENLELTYCGRILNDTDSVKDLALSPSSVIHAMVLSHKESTQPHILTTEEQRELLVGFRTAMTNPNFRQTLQKFAQAEKLSELVATTPGLADDTVAKSFIRDWELLLHLADSKSLQKIVKNHPALADAGLRIAATLKELTPSFDLRTLRGSQRGRLARSLGADLDDDDEMETEELPQAASQNITANTITPEQLSQALALAQRALESASRTPAPASSSRPQPSTSNSASVGSLTQQMFSNALLQAVASAGRPPTTETSSDLQQQFGRFLPQMRELGITDDTLSLRALQATNGDVQAAVNLIFAGLMDD